MIIASDAVMSRGTLAVSILAKGCGPYSATIAARMGRSAPAELKALGRPEPLRGGPLALFCSIKCPGSIILKTFDLMKELRDEGITVIGGFHSPMEKECLDILLRGKQPIIICPARSIETMRIPKEWRQSLEDERLLVLSPFPTKEKRKSSGRAEFRNRLVAALADRMLVPYAAPGSKTEQLCRTIISWGKPLFTFDTKYNTNLLALGARPFEVSSAATMAK